MNFFPAFDVCKSLQSRGGHKSPELVRQKCLKCNHSVAMEIEIESLRLDKRMKYSLFDRINVY